LTEGGFSGSGTEGKMAEPGSKNDPGRAGLESFTGVREGQGTRVEKGQYGVLKGDEQA
jgi:hypothetical protein